MIYKQSILDFEAAGRLAVAGMELAVETANAEHEKWSDRCWNLFFQWLNKKPRYFEFQVEDFREYVYQMDLIEKPKSDRAYGFLTVRAVKRELIEFVGNVKTSNKKAHRTPAGLWMKK